MCVKKYYSKCWKTLKIFKRQRRYEIKSSVNVTKVEKIKYMTYG
nr:MAG TPA: hypothetical protein [Caudoviricetes sp.]